MLLRVGFILCVALHGQSLYLSCSGSRSLPVPEAALSSRKLGVKAQVFLSLLG